jgi:hypothetical protein
MVRVVAYGRPGGGDTQPSPHAATARSVSDDPRLNVMIDLRGLSRTRLKGDVSIHLERILERGVDDVANTLAICRQEVVVRSH